MSSSSVLVFHVSIKIKCLCCCCSGAFMKVPQHREAKTISMLHNVYILSLLLSSRQSQGQAACSLLLCPRAAS